MTEFSNREELINTFLEENWKVNLSAIRAPQDVFTKHIQDSLEINKLFDLNKWYKIIDIWTWWGFPLLPLAISNPKSRFYWLDSIKKKINAIWNMTEKLNLKNVYLIWSRAENHVGKYDILTTRAMGYIDIILKNWLHLVKDKWFLILFKMYTEQENDDIKKLIKKHHLKLIKSHNYKLFENDIQRIIYILQK